MVFQPKKFLPPLLAVGAAASIAVFMVTSKKAQEVPLPGPLHVGTLPRLYAGDAIVIGDETWTVPSGWLVDVEVNAQKPTDQVEEFEKCPIPPATIDPALYAKQYRRIGIGWYFLRNPCAVDVDYHGQLTRLHLGQCFRKKDPPEKYGVYELDTPDCAGQKAEDVERASPTLILPDPRLQ